MPPNKEGKCDSCKEVVDILLPLWMLDETPCGLLMSERFYCPECYAIVVDEFEKNKEDEEESE